MKFPYSDRDRGSTDKVRVVKKHPNTGNTQIIHRVLREDEKGLYVISSGGKLRVKETETNAYESTGEWESK